MTWEENWFGKSIKNAQSSQMTRRTLCCLPPCHQWLPASTEVPKEPGRKPELGQNSKQGFRDMTVVGKKGASILKARRQVTPSPGIVLHPHRSPRHRPNAATGPGPAFSPRLRLPPSGAGLYLGATTPSDQRLSSHGWLSLPGIQVPAHMSSLKPSSDHSMQRRPSPPCTPPPSPRPVYFLCSTSKPRAVCVYLLLYVGISWLLSPETSATRTTQCVDLRHCGTLSTQSRFWQVAGLQ